MPLEIVRPTAILDKDKAIKNIERMIEKANKNNVFFRPHFKTHQSAEIGKWFQKYGVSAITVSSVDMAEYFVDNGWNDITIAFPTNIRQIKKINDLASKISLGLLIESEETLDFLLKNLTHQVTFWLKIDTAYHRTGIDWNYEPLISHLIRKIRKTSNHSFAGLLTHSGHSYKAKSISEIEDIYEDTYLKLKNLQERLMLQGFGIIKISIGDTPTCSVVDNFQGIDEIRPGNFVFYDITQMNLGSCNEEDIALTVACPVVAKHPEREELVIYGGAIHLSKEFLLRSDGSTSYGEVAFPKGNSWGDSVKEIYVKSISQEHGIIRCPVKYLEQINIGDLVYVLPIHSCLTANLMKKFYLFNGVEITTMVCK